MLYLSLFPFSLSLSLSPSPPSPFPLLSHSIGSLGKYGYNGCVSDISFSDLDISDALNAVRIKTYDGGKGAVSGISFTDVKIKNVARPITIDQQ